MRPRSFFVLSAIAVLLASCDEDFGPSEWGALQHVISPSGWCIAYVQVDTKSGRTTVLLDLNRAKCGSAVAADFRQASVPLTMQWIDGTTLKISYPKDVSLVFPCDAFEHIVKCTDRSVRVVLSGI